MCEWNHEKSMGANLVVLDLPEWCDTGKQNRTISADKCIAHVITHLWDHGIETLSNCCGHNKAKPSLVIAAGYNKTQINEIVGIIMEVDNRGWELQQWQILKVAKWINKRGNDDGK